MTEGEQPRRLDPALAERAAARRAGAGKRGHAAAATRLLVGGVALAGTFQMVAAMGEPAAAVAEMALPTTVVNGTVAPTNAAPRTVVVVRRHVLVAGSPTGSITSGGGATASASSPAPRASAPAPAPVTKSTGS